MLAPEMALEIARLVAACSGDNLTERGELLAQTFERLLVDLEIARAEAEHYRDELRRWGIPAKRATVRRIEGKGFEVGWNDG